jgi:hypothetical protein
MAYPLSEVAESDLPFPSYLVVKLPSGIHQSQIRYRYEIDLIQRTTHHGSYVILIVLAYLMAYHWWMANGRSFSKVRTPTLVREYLSGEPFPGAEEGEREAVEPGRGDYLASIHRHLKRRMKELSAEIASEREQPYRYHWPRYHSFATLMRNLMKLRLVERTSEVETSDILVLQGDPGEGGLSPGDLRLDPARGFQQRHYYRLAPGAEADLAWDNPMASIRAIYGIELVAQELR